jgi:hypothetical protein
VLWATAANFSYTLWTTVTNLVTRYRPLQQIGNPLVDTAADFVINYGPLHEMKPYNKNL